MCTEFSLLPLNHNDFHKVNIMSIVVCQCLSDNPVFFLSTTTGDSTKKSNKDWELEGLLSPVPPDLLCK